MKIRISEIRKPASKNAAQGCGGGEPPDKPPC